MRILQVGDVLVSSMFVKLFEDEIVVFAVDVGVQFPVGEGAGTAFTELYVGMGLQRFVV